MAARIIPINLGFVKSFLVIGEHVIIVDAGMPGSLKRILRAISENCVRYDDISLIVVTHAHTDHTGGLWDLKDMVCAPVAVHRSEAGCLEDGSGASVVLHSPVMKLLSGFMGGVKPRGVKPDILIDARLDLNPYGVDGFVLHTPGHTAGSMSMVLGSGEAIVGDMVGGLLRPALPGVYADLPEMKTSICLLKQTGALRVYTSHGGVHKLEDVLKLGL